MNVTTILITHGRRFLRRLPSTATIVTDLQNISQSSLSPATTPIAAAASTEAAAASVPSVTLDSSLTLTILVLLTAIFFMGLFSFLISRSTTAAHHPSAQSATAERRGVHPSVLSSLPLAAYSAEMAEMDGCSICLSEFSEGDSVKLIPVCGHVFHPRCVDTWLSAHVTCPLCRSAQLFKSGDEQATWTSDDVS